MIFSFKFTTNQVWILIASILFTSKISLASICPDGWNLLNHDNLKCVRYFKDNVNYTEAETICRDIYEGHLVVIESKQEQRSLVQYLHGEAGLTKTPVTWIGVKIEPPNRIVFADKSSTSKYTNFELEPVDLTEERCTKIFSLNLKNADSEYGLWSMDNCEIGDAGFVCQKIVPDHARSGSEVPQGDD